MISMDVAACFQGRTHHSCSEYPFVTFEKNLTPSIRVAFEYRKIIIKHFHKLLEIYIRKVIIGL